MSFCIYFAYMSLDYLISRFNSFSLEKKGLTPENVNSRITKELTYLPQSQTLYVVLPTWANTIQYLGKLKKEVRASNGSLLAYDFPREILSDDAELTRNCFVNVTERVRKDIAGLKQKHHFTKCVIIGKSLGTVYATMIADNNPDIDEILLITTANCLAEAMWTGCRTQHLRKSYEQQGIDLKTLKRLWEELAPENHIGFKDKKVSVYLSETDKVILPELGVLLVEKMRKSGLNPTMKENRYLGHYLTLMTFYRQPRKFLNFK